MTTSMREDSPSIFTGAALMVGATLMLLSKPSFRHVVNPYLFTNAASLIVLGIMISAAPPLLRKLFGTSPSTNSPNLLPSLPTKVRDKLLMTRSEYRKAHLSRNGRRHDKVVIGAAIFHKTNQKICLLKRAANEAYYPNVFELPSGNVDKTDASLMHTLIREVKEETGFQVTRIVAELDPFIYFTEKEVSGKWVLKSCIQLNFVVEVLGTTIRVNSEEHSRGIWAGREELRPPVEMTVAMSRVVDRALKWKEDAMDDEAFSTMGK